VADQQPLETPATVEPAAWAATPVPVAVVVPDTPVTQPSYPVRLGIVALRAVTAAPAVRVEPAVRVAEPAAPVP
jgi:hypothetical protein